MTDITPQEKLLRERQKTYVRELGDAIFERSQRGRAVQRADKQLLNQQMTTLPRRYLQQRALLTQQFNNGLDPRAFSRQIQPDRAFDSRSYLYG